LNAVFCAAGVASGLQGPEAASLFLVVFMSCLRVVTSLSIEAGWKLERQHVPRGR
jgi:hypothetical protein